MQKYTEENTSKRIQSEQSSLKVKRERRPVLPVLIALMLVGSLGIQGYLLSENMKVTAYVADQQRKEAEALEQENTYQEDGYKVGEQYEIRSTKAISDAYISGDESQLSQQDKETLKMAKEVVDKVIKDGMSNYEKEEAIYTWMVKNIGQGASTTVKLPTQSGGDQFTPNGVLSGHGAVCVGYATTFRLFMNMLGMDCHIVHNEYHSWDLVQLDDGEWYHTDVYSDASGTGKEPSFRNFNMNDASASFGHDWDQSALPEAKGVKYTAANQKKKDLKQIEEVPADIKKGFDNGQKVFFYQFDKVTEKDYPVADYIVTQLQSALSASGVDGYVSGSWYLNEDEARGYILGLYVETYDGSGMSEAAQGLSEERRQALTDAINQAFGTEIGIDPYSYGGYEEGEDMNAGEVVEGDMSVPDTDNMSDKSVTVKSDGKGSEVNSADYYADEDGE
ncbi:MAG: hypothetical protein K6B14_08985 [Lachnospiraceae bacterium]|nr:hypothetical protein [Lachnospiraceae bacterium]